MNDKKKHIAYIIMEIKRNNLIYNEIESLWKYNANCCNYQIQIIDTCCNDLPLLCWENGSASLCSKLISFHC